MGILMAFLMASIRIGMLGGHGYGHLFRLLGGHRHGLLGGYGHLEGIFNGFNQDWDVGWAWTWAWASTWIWAS
jgi:hypothetical protein